MTFPGIRPQRPVERYTPRVFGFKLHQSALAVCDGAPSGMRGGGAAAATPDGAAPPAVSAPASAFSACAHPPCQRSTASCA
jgi:hypothetical protein